MKLNLSSLEKAIQQFEKSLSYFNSEEGKDEGLHEQFRAAVVQAFEYTFELCWKFLKRYLEEETGDTTIDSYSKKELFRVGTEQGLLKNAEDWFDYLKARNETVHTYDESNADEVCRTAIKFLPDAKYLLSELQRRIVV